MERSGAICSESSSDSFPGATHGAALFFWSESPSGSVVIRPMTQERSGAILHARALESCSESPSGMDGSNLERSGAGHASDKLVASGTQWSRSALYRFWITKM